MLNNFKDFVAEITKLTKAHDNELRDEIVAFFRFDDSE